MKRRLLIIFFLLFEFSCRTNLSNENWYELNLHPEIIKFLQIEDNCEKFRYADSLFHSDFIKKVDIPQDSLWAYYIRTFLIDTTPHRREYYYIDNKLCCISCGYCFYYILTFFACETDFYNIYIEYLLCKKTKTEAPIVSCYENFDSTWNIIRKRLDCPEK